MSFTRKIKREQRLRISHKCPKCGAKLEYKKDLFLQDTKKNHIDKNAYDYHFTDVMYCHKCGGVFEIKANIEKGNKQ